MASTAMLSVHWDTERSNFTYPQYRHNSGSTSPLCAQDVLQTFIYLSKEAATVAMSDLIVKAAVKEALDDKNVSSDFYAALDDEVAEILEDAAARADANDRKTVQARDL